MPGPFVSQLHQGLFPHGRATGNHRSVGQEGGVLGVFTPDEFLAPLGYRLGIVDGIAIETTVYLIIGQLREIYENHGFAGFWGCAFLCWGAWLGLPVVFVRVAGWFLLGRDGGTRQIQVGFAPLIGMVRFVVAHEISNFGSLL